MVIQPDYVQRHNYELTVRVGLTNREHAELERQWHELQADYPGLYPTIETYLHSALVVGMKQYLRSNQPTEPTVFVEPMGDIPDWLKVEATNDQP